MVGSRWRNGPSASLRSVLSLETVCCCRAWNPVPNMFGSSDWWYCIGFIDNCIRWQEFSKTYAIWDEEMARSLATKLGFATVACRSNSSSSLQAHKARLFHVCLFMTNYIREYSRFVNVSRAFSDRPNVSNSIIWPLQSDSLHERIFIGFVLLSWCSVTTKRGGKALEPASDRYKFSSFTRRCTWRRTDLLGNRQRNRKNLLKITRRRAIFTKNHWAIFRNLPQLLWWGIALVAMQSKKPD